MKSFAAIALAMIPLASSNAEPPTHASQTSQQELEPVAIDLANQLLDIIAPPATRQTKLAERFKFVAEQVRAPYATKSGSEDAKFRALVDNNMDEMWQGMVAVIGRNLPAYYGAMARAYARRFTIPELREILAFAKTPAGVKFLQISSLIAQDTEVVAAQQQMLMDVRSGLPEMKKKSDASVAGYLANKSKAKAKAN